MDEALNGVLHAVRHGVTDVEKLTLKRRLQEEVQPFHERHKKVCEEITRQKLQKREKKLSAVLQATVKHRGWTNEDCSKVTVDIACDTDYPEDGQTCQGVSQYAFAEMYPGMWDLVINLQHSDYPDTELTALVCKGYDLHVVDDKIEFVDESLTETEVVLKCQRHEGETKDQYIERFNVFSDLIPFLRYLISDESPEEHRDEILSLTEADIVSEFFVKIYSYSYFRGTEAQIILGDCQSDAQSSRTDFNADDVDCYVSPESDKITVTIKDKYAIEYSTDGTFKTKGIHHLTCDNMLSNCDNNEPPQKESECSPILPRLKRLFENVLAPAEADKE